jgi:hypothetical protein
MGSLFIKKGANWGMPAYQSIVNSIFRGCYDWSAELALLDRLQSKLCSPDTAVLYEEGDRTFACNSPDNENW